MHDMTPELAPPCVAAENPKLADDLRHLALEARALAEAELAFQKTRAAYAGAEARGIALLGLGAAVLVFFSLMALVVGAVIALGPLLTPWGATAAVSVALLLVAGLCAVLAKARLAHMLHAISDRKG